MAGALGHDFSAMRVHSAESPSVQRSVWDGKDLDKDFWGWGAKGDAISTAAWDVAGLTPIGSLAGGIVEGGKSIYSSVKGNDEAARKYFSNGVLSGIGAIPGVGTLLGLAELDADAGLLGGGPEGDALANRLNGKSAEEAPTFSDMFYDDVGKPALDWALGPSPGTGAPPRDLGDVDDWPESKQPRDLGDVDDWPESKQPRDLGDVDSWPESQPRDLGDVDSWPESQPRDLGDIDE